MDIPSGSIDGDKLVWKMDMTVPMPMTLDCTATVDGGPLAVSSQLATLDIGTRDGALLIVSRDHKRAVATASIAVTLQEALERWNQVEAPLRALAAKLEAGNISGEFAWGICSRIEGHWPGRENDHPTAGPGTPFEAKFA